MKRILLFSLLLISASCLFAQTTLTLTSDSSVNSQIEADREGSNPADIYIANGDAYYYWDATYIVNFDLHIQGTSSDWIYEQETPPVFVPIPDDAGTVYAFLQIAEGGSVTLENLLFNGRNSTEGGDILDSYMDEVGATKMIIDNCCFSDMKNSIMEVDNEPDSISITNCIIINTSRTTTSPWGGHVGRFNTPGEVLILENNTCVNSGRILGNGGNFYTSNLIENHNSWINAQTNAQELHWWQALMANNIFYNWSWMGRQPSDVAYNYSITTYETFEGLELDSVSVYFGRNLLYRDPAIQDYYDTTLDTAEVMPYLCWNDAVDSTINADDNFTIGKSYWDIDPEFTTGPGNLDKMLEWLYYYYISSDEWPDWRVTSPVTYDSDGQPVLSWPPDFDLSYTNEYMLVGATDGLPMGDLNWFPDAKATYDANRDSYLAALEDSILNATSLYTPGDSLSHRITEDDLVSIEIDDAAIPAEYSLSSNYPNPFNPTTSIKFTIPESEMVSLKVYNILGQEVRTIVNKEMSAGTYKVDFDASSLSSGVYIYTIRSGSFTASKKMMLLK